MAQENRGYGFANYIPKLLSNFFPGGAPVTAEPVDEAVWEHAISHEILREQINQDALQEHSALTGFGQGGENSAVAESAHRSSDEDESLKHYQHQGDRAKQITDGAIDVDVSIGAQEFPRSLLSRERRGHSSEQYDDMLPYRSHLSDSTQIPIGGPSERLSHPLAPPTKGITAQNYRRIKQNEAEQHSSIVSADTDFWEAGASTTTSTGTKKKRRQDSRDSSQSPAPPQFPSAEAVEDTTAVARLSRSSNVSKRKEHSSKELWQTIPSKPQPVPSRSGSYISTRVNGTEETISTPSQAPESNLEGHAIEQLCEGCDIDKPNQAYCNVCGCTYCPTCWNMQGPHRRNQLAPGNIPHEKTDRYLALKIKSILEPEMTSEKEEALHTADESTTWFGIIREQGELPVFQDYGRYADLMADTGPQGNAQNHETRYPGLVSFVGQTGAGKSTLIKMVIDLAADDESTFATPIVGSVRNESLPTSGDVHLYPDPSSISTITPILYADCEGMGGGEREPVSSRFKKNKRRFAGVGRVSSFERKAMRAQHTSEREILWADKPAKQSREFAVTNLYPRLLFTFSDVVVFVLKEARTIEGVVEKLVEWAAAALEKSSNQPVLPHGIIVLNASANSTEPRLWDPDVATNELLQSLSKTVFHDKFKNYAKFWRERQRPIDTVEELLQCYYSSIKVIRIPTAGRPTLIADQISKLYRCIQSNCTDARLRKGGLRMLLDADELQPYLQYAFDHFANDLDSPFDFVQASFVNSPIPSDFGGNILKMAINMMDVWENVASGAIIFTELSYMVASCIMLDMTRHGIKGTSEQIFPQYVGHLDAALENFCDRHWPCEFIKQGKGGGRCVNVRSGHGSKGHQLKNGKVLAVGDYMSEFSFIEHQSTFQYDVFIRLDQLLHLLQERQREELVSEDQAATSIHLHQVMRNFYAHAMRGQPNTYVSHTACFCCLFEAPEHGLPCGHVLCTRCLKSLNTSHVRNRIEIDRCPIDGLKFSMGPWTFGLKPETAGIRILTLDGGGIRGIVELEILRQLETHLNGIPIRRFFDLIVGTSTGGIIALGLAARNWSVAECIQSFKELCGKAFTARAGSNIYGVGFLVEMRHHSRYETAPLQEALMEAYQDGYLFGGPREFSVSNAGPELKVAVTSTSASGTALVISNYNRPCQDKLSYHFQRAEKLSAELKTWEAARATSAAPRIFKPMSHEASKQVYTDGAIYHNNPIQIADQERKLLWPYLADGPPDIIVSIGTSYNPDSIRREKMQRTSTLKLGGLNHAKALVKIAMDHISSSLDSEKAWHDYLEVLNPPSWYRHRYIRLNPMLTEDPPALDEVNRMEYLQSLTRSTMMEDKAIHKTALQLIATSFYFEKTGQMENPSGHGYAIKGHIYCRLEGDDIQKLGRTLKFLATDWHPYFVLQEEHGSKDAERVLISLDVIELMIRTGRFRMKTFTLKLKNQYSNSEILISLTSDQLIHISNFPRSLLHNDTSISGTRHTIAANTSRWAGRSNSQRYRNWAPPTPPESRPHSDFITLYSKPTYVLGNTSTASFKASADRLNSKGLVEMGEFYDRELSKEEEDPGVPAIVQTEEAELYGSTVRYELA